MTPHDHPGCQACRERDAQVVEGIAARAMLTRLVGELAPHQDGRVRESEGQIVPTSLYSEALTLLGYSPAEPQSWPQPEGGDV